MPVRRCGIVKYSYDVTAGFIDAETQTDDLAVHGLIKFVEIIADENLITSTTTPEILVITESRVVLPLLTRQGWPKLRRSLR